MAEVVVTGVSSFVGHHLARHWALLGHHVIGTISRPRDRYLGIAAERIAAIEPYVEIFGLDLREPRDIAALVDRRAPSLWIQHAGFATAYSSFDYDLDFGHQLNVAPLTPLFAALRGGPCGVVITGSSAEYAVSEIGNREDDACAPDTPYGLSKLTQTLRARQLAEQFDIPTRVARLYIPFGSRDSPQKLLPQTIAKLRQGEPVALSPCEQRRDFLGVSDVCEAYVRLADDLARPGFDLFNIAGGIPVRLRDFLHEIADRIGAKRDLLHFGAIPMRPGELPASYADMGKARRVLGWIPTPLSAAIDRDLLAPGNGK
jgi:nucleoside-diphosphate-sugar epimerase